MGSWDLMACPKCGEDRRFCQHREHWLAEERARLLAPSHAQYSYEELIRLRELNQSATAQAASLIKQRDDALEALRLKEETLKRVCQAKDEESIRVWHLKRDLEEEKKRAAIELKDLYDDLNGKLDEAVAHIKMWIKLAMHTNPDELPQWELERKLSSEFLRRNLK